MAGLSSREGFLQFEFDVAGEEQIKALFQLAAENIRTIFTIAGPDIRDDFIAGMESQFSSEGQSGAGGWKRLNPQYELWKNQHFPGGSILVRSGAMKRGLTQAGDPGFIYRATDRHLALGTRDPKAIYHQDPKRGSSLPQRKLIALTSDQQRRWPKLMQESIFKSGQGYERKLL